MCRNKRRMAILPGLALAIFLSGCGEGSSLVTDTGSGRQQEIALEDYLKTDVLETQEENIDKLYNVLTLENGTFQEQALKQTLERSFINVAVENLDLDGAKAHFAGQYVDFMDYVEEGEAIASLNIEVDELALEEAQLRLQRLQERYKDAEIKLQEDLQDITEQRGLIYNDYKRAVCDIRYSQRQLDWEYEKYNYENQIEKAKETVENLSSMGKWYDVKANVSGYVVYGHRYVSGEEVKDGDYLCHIMNSNKVYTATDAQADQFAYGMEVGFNTRDGLTPATVVSGGTWALHGNLDKGQVIFRLDFEQDVSELDHSMLKNLVLNATIKTVENVIVIPKQAVTVEDNEYYVTVLKEDGSLLKTEFIPGGSNLQSYWVLDGLTEGMQIIY